MEGKVTVVGTGPGHSHFLTSLGKKMIDSASVVVGGKRLLDTFTHPGQQQFIVDRDLKGAVQFIEKHYRTEKLVVLVSGDTGIYSLASYIVRNFPPEAVEFIPGVSSVQLMYARLKKPWQNASIVSVHGRVPEGIGWLVKGGTQVAVLTDNRFTPRELARYLIEQGCRDYPVAVGTSLSYENERVIFSTLKEMTLWDSDPAPAVVVINYE